MNPEPVIYRGSDKEMVAMVRELEAYLNRIVSELNEKD